MFFSALFIPFKFSLMFFSAPFYPLLVPLMFFSALFRIVIVNFDGKNYATTCAGDGVGDEHWPDDARAVQ